MAVYYFRDTGDVNWGTATNWSLTDGGPGDGAVPTAADDAYFTDLSGDCTINASARVCKTLIFSGVGGDYSNTFNLLNQLTVSGDITLSPLMTFIGLSTLVINANSTIISTGVTITGNLTLNTASTTIIINGDLTVNGNYTVGNTIVNGSKINLKGDLTVTAGLASGTPTSIVELNGIGDQTWSGNNIIRQPLIINKTSGDFIVSGTVRYAVGTLTILSLDTYTVTGSTLNIAGNANLNTSGITWDSVSFLGGAITTTLLSDFYADSFSFSYNDNLSSKTFNGFNIYLSGSLLGNNGISNSGIQGTSHFHMIGTGTLSFPQQSNVGFNCDLTINTSGTITLLSGVTNSYGENVTWTHLSGTVITTNTTVRFNKSCNLNLSGVTFNSVVSTGVAGNRTFTLLSDFNCSSWSLASSDNSILTINGNNVNLRSMSINTGTGVATFGGTSVINFVGITPGSWTTAGTNNGRNTFNFVINTISDLTFSGTHLKTGGSIVYLNGNVITTGSTLSIGGSMTLNTPSTGMSWNNVTITTGTITISNEIIVEGNYTVGNTTVNGSKINLKGNLTISATLASGTPTSTVEMNGTGNQTWSGNFQFRQPLIINKTSGDFIVSGIVSKQIGSLVILSLDTYTVTGSTVNSSTTMTWNTSLIVWNNVTLNGSGNIITLSSNVNVGGTLNLGTASASYTINGSNIICSGSVSNTATNATILGTTNLILNGTGSFTMASGSRLDLNINVDTLGTITFNFTRVGNKAFTYVSGTVIFTGTFICATSYTFNNVSSLLFNLLTLSTGGNATYTLNSDIYCNSLTIGGNIGTTQTVNNNNIYIYNGYTNGNATLSTTNTGTAILNFIGTGATSINQSVTSTSTCNLNIVINKPSGTLTIGSNGLNFRYGTRTIKWVSGDIDVITPLLITGNMTFDTDASYWSSIDIPTHTITTNSELNVGSLSLGSSGNVIFTTTGTTGFNANLINITPNRTITLKDGAYYNTNNITKNTSTSGITIQSSSGTLRSYLNYYNTEPIGRFNGIRIDSSGGSTIYTNINTTLTDTINWNKMEGTGWWVFLQ